MKRTVRILALAAPLATVAISLGATPALADPGDPDVLTQPTGHGDPEPKPVIDDKAPLPDDPDQPDVPDDKDGPNNDGDPEPDPGDGPDDKAGPNPGDGPDDKDGPKPGDTDEKEPGDKGDDNSSADAIITPTRIDAGAGARDEGMELAWLLAGGALVTASGAAYAVRRRARASA